MDEKPTFSSLSDFCFFRSTELTKLLYEPGPILEYFPGFGHERDDLGMGAGASVPLRRAPKRLGLRRLSLPNPLESYSLPIEPPTANLVGCPLKSLIAWIKFPSSQVNLW